MSDYIRCTYCKGNKHVPVKDSSGKIVKSICPTCYGKGYNKK